jgi:2-polyprenyl-3-methyl-5-hydroxy-6-metoxy-1,4-benzoquinol methylase
MDLTPSEQMADSRRVVDATDESRPSSGHATDVSAAHFDQFAGEYKELLDQSIAFSGEGSEYFYRYKANYLARIFSPQFSGRVLDYGCGVGILSRFLKAQMPGAQINGFDVSKDAVGRVDEALLRQGEFTSDLERLRGGYDLIVVTNVMHHVVPGQRQAVVSDLAGRLATGGRLVILEHNPINPGTRMVVERCAFDEGVILLTPREVARYFSAAGLHVARRDYIVFMPRFLSWLRPVEPWLAWLPLGAQFTVIGEKHA